MTSHPPPAATEHSSRGAEQRRHASVSLVQCVYRLAKACQLYDDANQTVQHAIQPVSNAVGVYCAVFDTDVVRVLISADRVLVNRVMLRTSREAYALALQVGELLNACGTNEIAFERGVSGESIRRFFRVLAQAQRDPAAAKALREGSIPGVSSRLAPDADTDADGDPRESSTARALKLYATAIVIVRSFHDKLARGDTSGARDVKRIAHKLAAVVEDNPELMTAAAAGALREDDRGRRAVSTAIIALAMLRQVTRERSLHATLALAALTADAGGSGLGAGLVEGGAGARAVSVLAETGQFYAAALRRNVIVYEALDAGSACGEVYGGLMRPTSLSSILFMARRFNELRTPLGGHRPLGVEGAVEQIARECRDELEQAYVRLLVVALGFLPPGTVVQLDTGEIATVAGVPKAAQDFARPPVRVVTDLSGQPLSRPYDLDLARQPTGVPLRAIQRVGAAAGPGPGGGLLRGRWASGLAHSG